MNTLCVAEPVCSSLSTFHLAIRFFCNESSGQFLGLSGTRSQ